MTQINLDLGIANLRTPANPVFARHETFHPRFGWIKKGFDAAGKNSKIFLLDDATVRLGVGKNMVSSIRYWCNAFKVLEDDDNTEFGDKLLGDDGWDEFLEDPASLWLLHWNLLKQPCYATAWNYTFNIFREVEFSADDLFYALGDYRNSLGIRIVDSSLRKDVTCILRMYVEQDSKTGPNEDSLDCPFTELGIIQPAGDARHYTFRVGSKANLPAEIIVSACLEFASWVGNSQRTISISRLTFDTDSPGMAFKLSESGISEAIEQVARWSGYIMLSDTAGLIQLSYTQDPATLAEDILDRYYQARRGEAES